jgi:hypothetical protein
LAEISESPISVFVASEMIQSISRDCTYWFIQNFYSSSEVSGKSIGEWNRYRCIYHLLFHLNKLRVAPMRRVSMSD